MIYILEIVLSGLLGILIGYLVSILFVKDYSLKGVMKKLSKILSPLYPKKDKRRIVWAVMYDGKNLGHYLSYNSTVLVIDVIRESMKRHDKLDKTFSIIPAAAFVLYADELSYEDRCKSYRDVRDAIREYKKYK